jgi:hypothetical protein
MSYSKEAILCLGEDLEPDESPFFTRRSLAITKTLYGPNILSIHLTLCLVRYRI